MHAHLSKVALEGAVDRLRLAAENGGCVILGHSQRVAAVHPVVAWLVLMDLATRCWRPSWTLPHICNMLTLCQLSVWLRACRTEAVLTTACQLMLLLGKFQESQAACYANRSAGAGDELMPYITGYDRATEEIALFLCFTPFAVQGMKRSAAQVDLLARSS